MSDYPTYTRRGIDGLPGLLISEEYSLSIRPPGCHQVYAEWRLFENCGSVLPASRPIMSTGDSPRAAYRALDAVILSLLESADQYQRLLAQGEKCEGLIYSPTITKLAHALEQPLIELHLTFSQAQAVRDLAYLWHGGQSSAIYAYASSGVVKSLDQLKAEIDYEIAQADADARHGDLNELARMHEYVEGLPLDGNEWIAPWAL